VETDDSVRAAPRNSRQDRSQVLHTIFFDETALVSSQEELLEQLPDKIFHHSDGIPFTELFSTLTNECPVTAEIMKDVLSDLAKQGVIQVKDKTGEKARRVGIQQDSDIIIPSRQMRLFTK